MANTWLSSWPWKVLKVQSEIPYKSSKKEDVFKRTYMFDYYSCCTSVNNLAKFVKIGLNLAIFDRNEDHFWDCILTTHLGMLDLVLIEYLSVCCLPMKLGWILVSSNIWLWFSKPRFLISSHFLALKSLGMKIALFPEAWQTEVGQLEINFKEVAVFVQYNIYTITYIDHLSACCFMGHTEGSPDTC